MSTTVLSYHNTCLTTEDLKLLEESQWLNDKIIGFVLEYYEFEMFPSLSSSVCFVSPVLSQLIKLVQSDEEISFLLEPLGCKTKEIIALVVNNNDSVEASGGVCSYTTEG